MTYPELKGKIAIVTGASLGIGSAIAKALGDQGCAVAVNYRKHAEEAESLTSAIVKAGGKAKAYQCDVGDPAQVQAMVEAVGSDRRGNRLRTPVDGRHWRRIWISARTRPSG